MSESLHSIDELPSNPANATDTLIFLGAHFGLMDDEVKKAFPALDTHTGKVWILPEPGNSFQITLGEAGPMYRVMWNRRTKALHVEKLEEHDALPVEPDPVIVPRTNKGFPEDFEHDQIDTGWHR